MICQPGALLTRQSSRSALPLDIATGAAIGLSLRKVRNAWAGSCVNIRRSSDSTAADIGFSGGDLDLNAFNAFVGGGNGFVTSWYDQSGNGNHAVQATAGQQPQLVTSIAALNGRQGVLFADATSQALTVAAAASFDNPFAAGGFYTAVTNLTTATGGRRGFQTGAGAVQLFIDAPGALHVTQGASVSGGSFITTPVLANGAHQIDFSYSSASLANVPAISWEGTTRTLGTSTAPVGTITTDTGAVVGGNNVNGWPGSFSEVLVYKTAVPTAAQITALRANQKAYWGTP